VFEAQSTVEFAEQAGARIEPMHARSSGSRRSCSPLSHSSRLAFLAREGMRCYKILPSSEDVLHQIKAIESSCHREGECHNAELNVAEISGGQPLAPVPKDCRIPIGKSLCAVGIAHLRDLCDNHMIFTRHSPVSELGVTRDAFPLLSANMREPGFQPSSRDSHLQSARLIGNGQQRRSVNGCRILPSSRR
jgi:hypothetical protein